MNEMNLLRAALAIPVDCINNLQSDTTIVVNPIPPEVCQFIITDKHWLIENILCLLSNATKYSTCKSHLSDLILSYLISFSFLPLSHRSPLSSHPYSLIILSFNSPIRTLFTTGGAVNLILELDFQTHEFLSHKILRVTIEDSGIGIPNEARQKLFQPFTQAQRMTGLINQRRFN